MTSAMSDETCCADRPKATSTFRSQSRYRVSESRKFEVRADFFNVLNQANRSNPISDITTASSDSNGFILSPGDFGRSVSFDSSPRIIQMSVRLLF